MIPDITPASATDLPAIFALLDANKLPRAGLEQHVACTLVAREHEDIVGTAALELYGRSALLRSVAVDPRLRSRGLGRALTAAALDLARLRGVRSVYLLTETAADFFPKLGFRRIERTAVDPAVLVSEEFTSACPTSAAVMVLPLTPNP
jgi:amino-acid N-acetyltransferase